MLSELWSALGGHGLPVHDVQIMTLGRYLPAAYDVDGLAVASVAAALLAAAELAESRGAPRPALALDAQHVAAAFRSERQLLLDGRSPGSTFAPLSRLARTADGWIRLHANYRHHRQALLAVVGGDERDVLTRVAERGALELEGAIVEAGGAAGAVRTRETWAAHPQGRTVLTVPLIARFTAPTAEVTGRLAESPPTHQPAAGLRVLDLTRVIAGPVTTRFLAALGADVLRLDPPQLPEEPLLLLDTGSGKRLAELDLGETVARARLHELLADADALVHGYRPGAPARFGIEEDQLAERHPHLAIASLSAWGHAGPWAQRRGFDSVVQAACGIAAEHATPEGTPATPEGTPGALPAQALDHATGYLIAASILRSTP